MTSDHPPPLNLRAAARASDGGAFDADLLDLPWECSITEWPERLFLALPKGISRHEVRFLERRGTILAIKELPEAAARNDFLVLSELEDEAVPTVHPVAVLTGRSADPTEEAVVAIMVDAETAELHDLLSVGQRELDLEIMVVNVAGGMADLAAQSDITVDDADLRLGEDVARSYRRLWKVISDPEPIAVSERWGIRERIVDLEWRLQEFEPWIARLADEQDIDPVQAFCDLLHHRWLLSSRAERAVSTEEAHADWVAVGRPGRSLPDAANEST